MRAADEVAKGGKCIYRDGGYQIYSSGDAGSRGERNLEDNLLPSKHKLVQVSSV